MKKRFNPATILLFIPALVIGLTYFELESVIRQEKFREKWLDTKSTVDLTLEHTDMLFASLGDWNGCEESLVVYTSALDSLDGVYAVLYDKDYRVLSHRTDAVDPPFDPLRDSEFFRVAGLKSSGEIDILIGLQSAQDRVRKVYFRHYNSYLVVVGMSMSSIGTQVSRRVLGIFVMVWVFSAVGLMAAAWFYLKLELKILGRALHDTP